jgi:hypothetical protein
MTVLDRHAEQRFGSVSACLKESRCDLQRKIDTKVD